MSLDRFFKTLGPVIAMALAGAASGCDGAKVHFEGKEGVPLDELDTTGAAPEAVSLLGPDEVRITRADRFSIRVEGSEEVAARMRFSRDGETLQILRQSGDWNSAAHAIVHVAMPAPQKLAILGSGSIASDSLAKDAEITIAGSGDVTTPEVDVDKLEVNILGSGDYSAAGRARELEISIMASGNVGLDRLKAEEADISIMGSGNVKFASDGDVKAKIMGSGNVTVSGAARCTVNSLGSGKLVCEREATVAD